MKYKIVIAPTIYNLEIEINELVKKWGKENVIPIGGPNSNKDCWFQAIWVPVVKEYKK